MHDVGAEQLERAPQDHRRRDAVDVVVAVDGDPLLARDRREDAIDRDRACRRAASDRAGDRATGSGSARPAPGRRARADRAAARRSARRPAPPPAAPPRRRRRRADPSGGRSAISVGPAVACDKLSTRRTQRTRRTHVRQLFTAELTRQHSSSAAIEVHTALGPGLLESAVSTPAFVTNLTRMGLHFEHREVRFPWCTTESRLETGYRVDFLVEDCVIVEIKCVETILPVHEAQLLSYLKLSR